ncbi:MAG: hypothetical protein ACK58L_05065 [Planctomycetota bacterium]
MSGHRTTWQQFFCLLLCVSAWRGPVLMLHHHDAFSDEELRNLHVQQFHRDEVCHHEGIHWHFGNPKDLTGQTVFPEDQIPIDTAAFATSALYWSMSVHAPEISELRQQSSGDLTESLGATLAATPRMVGGPCSFAASLLMDAPLVCVTGVCVV